MWKAVILPIWQAIPYGFAILKAEMSGLDTHIHTIGDRATDMSISAIEYAQRETAKLKGKTDFRNCLVHLQIADSEQAKKMAAQSDGAIVGSAIVKLCAKYGEGCVPYVQEYVREMKNAVRI